jgi:hypothetical protein
MIAGAFVPAEPRARVLAYLCGLLGQLERKNGWTLAEAAGEVSPDGIQRLRIGDWNADVVRDELRSCVVEHLGRGGMAVHRHHRARSTTARSASAAPTPPTPDVPDRPRALCPAPSSVEARN